MSVGLIGAGIRGSELIRVARGLGANIAMACDLYNGHLRRVQEIVPSTPVTRRFEEVLENPDIGSVLVATSDHWHAPIAIAAMRAGKDVYCEKPMAHSIPEALEMVRVSRETRRLVQVGSQSVSMTSTQKAKAWFDAGAIGKVYMVQCSIYRPDAIGAWRYPVPPDAGPETIDWERFLGNAPKRPFDPQRFFRFRNWWDYGTGIAGDEYVHLLSRVHYVLDVQYPLSAVAEGGLYKWRGDREVPDIHNTLYEYPGFTVQVSANLVSNWEGGEIVRFMGDRGTIELTEESATLFPYTPSEDYDYPLDSWPSNLRNHFKPDPKDYPAAEIETDGRQTQRPQEKFKQTAEGTDDHMRNFFECVKSREQPVENVDFGCGTAIACHMANISYREKKRVFWDSHKSQLRA
jgi:predicted dehydrogenase